MGTGQSPDRYVTGGVNWESYSLEALVAMVADNANPAQLEQLADDWRNAGAQVGDAAAVLEAALAQLMEFWSGAAAEQARHDVALNAQWVADLGDTAHRIGTPIEEAAGALRAAQDAMPQIPPKPPVPPAQAVESADAALARGGGPLAAAISGAAAGTESAFEAQQEEQRLKAVAVEAMKRFEGAALGIDEATPAFEEPATELRPLPDDPSTPPLPKPPDLTGWPDTTVSYTTDVEMRWMALTADTGTTAQGYEDQHRQAAGAGSGPGGGGSGHAGGGGGGGVSTLGSTTGRLPLQPGMVTGATEAPSQAPRSAPGPLAASTGGAGTGTGMGMGGMPMGGMGAGMGQDAGEHRRRYPYDAEDPFALDEKASPPVIGL